MLLFLLAFYFGCARCQVLTTSGFVGLDQNGLASISVTVDVLSTKARMYCRLLGTFEDCCTSPDVEYNADNPVKAAGSNLAIMKVPLEGNRYYRCQATQTVNG
eukprot:tig00000480_g1302.t1